MSEHCSGESGTRLSGGVFPSRIKPIFTIAKNFVQRYGFLLKIKLLSVF